MLKKDLLHWKETQNIYRSNRSKLLFHLPVRCSEHEGHLIPDTVRDHWEVLRDLERDLDFISRSPPPDPPDPRDLERDLERLFSLAGDLLLDRDLLRDFSSLLGLPDLRDPDLDLDLDPFLLPVLDLDLPRPLLDLVLDLVLRLLDRLLDPFFLLSSTILILRPFSSVSSSFSIALRTSSYLKMILIMMLKMMISYLANSTTPSLRCVLCASA